MENQDLLGQQPVPGLLPLLSINSPLVQTPGDSRAILVLNPISEFRNMVVSAKESRGCAYQIDR